MSCADARLTSKREQYRRSASRESDQSIVELMEAHKNLASWHPGGKYFQDPAQRIWMRAVKLEAVRRGIPIP